MARIAPRSTVPLPSALFPSHRFLQIADINLTTLEVASGIFVVDLWIVPTVIAGGVIAGGLSQSSGIADFTPSVTARAWGKAGARTAGGTGAGLFSGLILLLRRYSLRHGFRASPPLRHLFNCYNFEEPDEQQIPPFFALLRRRNDKE